MREHIRSVWIPILAYTAGLAFCAMAWVGIGKIAVHAIGMASPQTAASAPDTREAFFSAARSLVEGRSVKRLSAPN